MTVDVHLHICTHLSKLACLLKTQMHSINQQQKERKYHGWLENFLQLARNENYEDKQS